MLGCLWAVEPAHGAASCPSLPRFHLSENGQLLTQRSRMEGFIGERRCAGQLGAGWLVAGQLCAGLQCGGGSFLHPPLTAHPACPCAPHGDPVFDFASKYKEASKDLAEWYLAGKIKSQEHVIDGLEHAADSLQLLFSGGNTGKLLVRIADPSPRAKL